MSQIEKQSLIDALTLKIAENYNIEIKSLKRDISLILQNYHVTISAEKNDLQDTSTEYLLNKFIQGKSASGMSENTIKQYKIAIAKLEEYTNKNMADIEPEDLNRFLKEYSEKVSSVTLRGKYQLISSIYNYLFNHQYLNYNPILYTEPPKATVVYKEPLSDLDMEKIKKACEELPEEESLRDNALIHFFTSTGCRVSELCNIKIKDVDFDKKICKVLGKGRKERFVVLSDKAIYRLKLYLDTRKNLNQNSPLFAHIKGNESKLTKDGVEVIVHKLRDSAGLKKLSCHTFRRYYATELRKRNVSLQMIATSLGHANLNQINRYSLYDSSELLNSIRNVL